MMYAANLKKKWGVSGKMDSKTVFIVVVVVVVGVDIDVVVWKSWING